MGRFRSISGRATIAAAIMIAVTLVSGAATAQAASLKTNRFDSIEEAVAAGAVDTHLVRALTTRGSARAIVSFDDVEGRQVTVASTLSRSQKDRSLSLVRSRLASMKSMALGDGINVIDDYEYLPNSFVRLDSLDALLDMLNAPHVIGLTTPLTGTTTLAQSLPMINADDQTAAGNRGQGTYVVVLDTGVDYTNASFGCTALNTPSTCPIYYMADYGAEDGYLDNDPSRHGSNVSAIVHGVAPDAKILTLDVFRTVNSDGSLGWAQQDVINALNDVVGWSATMNIVAVNMSIGVGMQYNTSDCTTSPLGGPNPFTQVFATLWNWGVVSVVSAGNDRFLDGVARTGLSFPACTPGALSVGAVYDGNNGGLTWGGQGRVTCTDQTSFLDRVTCFSQTGAGLDVLAPGARITAGGSTIGGTSQAAPHVAGTVAVLAAARPVATISQVWSAITGNGPWVSDPYTGAWFHRLDVTAALGALGTGVTDTTPPTVTAPVQTIAGGTVGLTTVPITVSWSGADASGIASYELWVNTNGTGWVRDTQVPSSATSYTYPSTPVGKSYQFFVRAYDAAGNVSADTPAAYGQTFTPTVVDDRSTAISYVAASGSTTKTWANSSWAPAYQGTIKISSKAGEYARYTFTGRDIAYVASLGINRGKAKVFIDGVLYTTVDLYQAAGSAARIAVTKHWAASGTHTIDVQTISSSGRPTAIDVDAFVVLKYTN